MRKKTYRRFTHCYSCGGKDHYSPDCPTAGKLAGLAAGMGMFGQSGFGGIGGVFGGICEDTFSRYTQEIMSKAEQMEKKERRKVEKKIELKDRTDNWIVENLELK